MGTFLSLPTYFSDWKRCSFLIQSLSKTIMQEELKKIFGESGVLDTKSVDFLTSALAKNNQPGFDYLEFKLSLDKLKEMGMDEVTAFKSAFATASTVGLTKDKLVSTAQLYKQVLSKEKGQFDLALNNQLEKRVNGKRSEVEKLKNRINEWREKIAILEEQIARSQATIDDADNQIQTEMKKIEATKNSFEKTHQSIFDQIERDLVNIQSHL